jgi:hypothetical protein
LYWASGQHSQTDLIKRHGVAKSFGKVQPVQCIRHIKGNDQAVIGVSHFNELACQSDKGK